MMSKHLSDKRVIRGANVSSLTQNEEFFKIFIKQIARKTLKIYNRNLSGNDIWVESINTWNLSILLPEKEFEDDVSKLARQKRAFWTFPLKVFLHQVWAIWLLSKKLKFITITHTTVGLDLNKSSCLDFTWNTIYKHCEQAVIRTIQAFFEGLLTSAVIIITKVYRITPIFKYLQNIAYTSLVSRKALA